MFNCLFMITMAISKKNLKQCVNVSQFVVRTKERHDEGIKLCFNSKAGRQRIRQSHIESRQICQGTTQDRVRYSRVQQIQQVLVRNAVQV